LERLVRTQVDLIARVPQHMRHLLRAGPQPEWIPPMLATLTHRRFSSDDWIFERKLDGERCLAYCRDASSVHLFSRNRLGLDGTYPEILDALRSEREHDVVLDGEVVAFENGQTSFARLQRRIGITDPEAARRSGVAVSYYIFDLLRVDGYDITALPLRMRKTLLRQALTFDDPLRFSVHRNRDGEAFFAEACRRGWEGLIAKRVESPYVPYRSTDWLKFRCSNEQEMVVGGFTDPKGSRVGFGALLLGYYEGDRLMYAGKVGTGFDTATLLSLRRRLDELERPQSPYADSHRVRERGVHWVEPVLVAQVAFSEWTRDGMLRHPRFVGLRDDKSAREVVRESGAV
jgi:bifunctional non-homologous end joining protein LigD